MLARGGRGGGAAKHPGHLLDAVIARQRRRCHARAPAADVLDHTQVLIGQSGDRFAIGSLEYNPTKHIAIWHLQTPFTAGRVRLNIDTTWVGDIRFETGILR